jgi:hypothetical protein
VRSWTTFKAGKSGNPGGHPKDVAEVRALANERTRVAAAEALLDSRPGQVATAGQDRGDDPFLLMMRHIMRSDGWRAVRWTKPATSGLL